MIRSAGLGMRVSDGKRGRFAPLGAALLTPRGYLSSKEAGRQFARFLAPKISCGGERSEGAAYAPFLRRVSFPLWDHKAG